MYEALLDERDRWLEPWENERTPQVVMAVANERVVLAPWVDEAVDDIDVLVTGDGGQGSQLTVTVHSRRPISADERKAVRYRLGTLFGEALRDWVDGA